MAIVLLPCLFAVACLKIGRLVTPYNILSAASFWRFRELSLSTRNPQLVIMVVLIHPLVLWYHYTVDAREGYNEEFLAVVAKKQEQ